MQRWPSGLRRTLGKRVRRITSTGSNPALCANKGVLMQKSSKYATFNYQEDDIDLIDQLAECLDINAERIFDFFGVDIPKQKITINIIPTKKEFDEIFISDHEWTHSISDFKVPDWAIGYFKNNQITYLSINDYKSTSHAFKKEDYPSAILYYKKTIVHEFVHYVNELFKTKHCCSYTEKYLSEGIATYLSKQKENKNLEFNFTIEQILSYDMKKTCYDGWYLITKYLVENFDKEFVFELFKSNRKAREFLQSDLYEQAKKYYNEIENEI